MSFETEAPKLWLQYSESNDFFPETMDFLQKIGFVSILSIDMDIKYSFQKTSWNTIIQGAEIETYDNDHTINDNFFVHKMTIPWETAITRSLVYIKLNQKKSVSIKDIAGFVRSFPMVSLLIFFVLSLFASFLPWVIWGIGKFFLIINSIAIVIFLFFFIYKLIKYVTEITKMWSKSMQDYMITYTNPYDLRIFTKAAKDKISELGKTWITDIAINRNTLYIKEDLMDDSKISLIWLIFWKRKAISSEEKEKVMDKMIDVLSDQNLLDIFKDDDN